MIRSLRGRLFVGLAVFILATGLVAGAVTFRWAYAEALEAQDAILLQVGSLVAANRVQIIEPVPYGVDAENLVVVEELTLPHGGTAANPGSVPLPPDVSDGLQTIAGGRWRVLVRSRADGSRVAIGQRAAYRDEIARGSALRTVLPFAVLIPCLMILVAAVIRHSLRPVARLARDLDASDYDHLAELPLTGMPDELHPFIQSINRLLRRIAMMIEQQRRFVADAAHELRSPITALSVQAENFDHAKLSPGSRGRLAALQAGIRRTGHLLEQLLALARYDSPVAPTKEIAALDRIARDVVADLLPAARARAVDLGFEHVESLSVCGDATALAVLIRNLVDNALRYTPDGGRVDLHLYAEDINAVLRVEDTGPGICKDDLPHVFEPFYRGQRGEGAGTGLGLSIVDRIVKGVAGSVAVENIPAPAGSGLRVTVTLPLATAPRARIERARPHPFE